jgi:DNA-binding GntR family transcriptional regulator
MEADFCPQCNAFLYTIDADSDYRSLAIRRRLHLAPSMSSTADTIHAKIYDAIVEQRLPPGTKLGEESLCEIFGVSRTLIRRVLQRLANEHVVESRPHRGACVARPSVDEAREVFEARRALEAHVIDRLAGGLTPADAARLRRHVAAVREAHAAGDRRHLIRRSGEFHLLLAEIVGNRAIARFLRELVSRTSLIIALYEAPGESCCSFDDHAEIIEALVSRRAQLADQAMRAHLLRIEQRLRLNRSPERRVDLHEVLAPGRRGSRIASRRSRAAAVLAPGG